MKIVITGYNTCAQNSSGGVQVRVRKIYEHLLKRDDVEVEYFCPMTTKLCDCDILHIFKLEQEYFNLILCAKKLGIKIVLSSIITITDGWKLDVKRTFLQHILPKNTFSVSFQIMNLVDLVIVESFQEKEFIFKHFKKDLSKIIVIPNGIDCFSFSGKQIFEKLRGIKEYALMVGRVDENKNVLNVIKALKGTGIDLVIVGGGYFEESAYYKKCIAEAKGNEHIHFLGWIDNKDDLLKSAYVNAKVFVLASFHETFGMVALEAGVAGCNIAMSKSLPIHDFHVFDDCWLFDPSNTSDIRSKIISAFNAPLTNALHEKVINTFSWNRIVNEHVKIYKELVYGNI